MRERRRGFLSRLRDLLQRMIGTGGGGEEPLPPILREEEPVEQETLQPLPSGPGQLPEQQEQVIFEEETITPGVVPSTNVEYIPGHHSIDSRGRPRPVYGRYRVEEPMTGDLQDLMYTPGTSEITIVIVGRADRYAGISMYKEVASYKIDVARMQNILEKTPANTIEEAMNEYLVQEGTEWSEISEINIVNYQDRPQ